VLATWLYNNKLVLKKPTVASSQSDTSSRLKSKKTSFAEEELPISMITIMYVVFNYNICLGKQIIEHQMSPK